MLPITLGMMFGPFMRWGKDDIRNLLSRLYILLIILIFISLLMWYLNFGGPIISIIFFILSAWIITSSLFEFSKFISISPKVIIKKIPLNIFSQSFAHIGIALVMIGATGSSILKIEKIQFQEINQIIPINNFDVKFLGVKLIEKDNYVSQMGHFEISKNNVYVKTLFPEKRMYNTGKQVTTEASIYSTFLGDLYIAIGENNSLNKNSWTTRVWFNPFTIWIWIGVLFLVIGGMISLIRIIKQKKMKYILLLIFLLSTGFLFYEGLKTDPSLVPSNLISKKVPIFELKKLNNHELLTPSDLQNQKQLKIVNFFASWCPPCKVEHPQLMELANNYKIYGIAKKDNEENVNKWLKTNGNPFTKIGLDDDGISSIEWGVYGLPETFLIDKKGSIIYRHVGPIMSKDLEKFRNILK